MLCNSLPHSQQQPEFAHVQHFGIVAAQQTGHTTRLRKWYNETRCTAALWQRDHLRLCRTHIQRDDRENMDRKTMSYKRDRRTSLNETLVQLEGRFVFLCAKKKLGLILFCLSTDKETLFIIATTRKSKWGFIPKIRHTLRVRNNSV